MEINCFETDLELYYFLFSFTNKTTKKRKQTNGKMEKKRKTSSSNTLSITIITDLI